MHSVIVGFILGISQIAVIGIQNAFVLKTGILGRPIFLICLLCSVCDAIIITLGIVCGTKIVANVDFMRAFQITGGCFLLFCGAKLLHNIIKGKHLDLNKSAYPDGNIFLTVIAVSIFNPQSFVDCVMVIGSVSTKFIDKEKIFFTIGCITASIVWFFTLGYFSKKISHIFHKPITWKILDGFMAIVMFILAYKLLEK